MIQRVAVVEWTPGDGLARAIGDEITELGIEPVLFPFNGAIPSAVNMVLTFAPYDKILPIASQMARYDPKKRPVYVHWQTQNLPNPDIPWLFTKLLAGFRSWIDRLPDSQRSMERFVATLKSVQWLSQRMYRFRYVGDIQYAYSQGWLDILVESSTIFAQNDTAHGIPAVYVPWGTFQSFYANLHLRRDIDVLWFGKRRTRRRSQLLDAIRRELRTDGIEIHVIDGEEHPFIYGDERSNILNRSKIVLNLQIYPYDNVFPYRFHIVAGNRCLVISEPELNHHPYCIPGKHFVATEADQIVTQILYYLNHEDERLQITENAYCLATETLTMAKSLRTILSLAENKLMDRV